MFKKSVFKSPVAIGVLVLLIAGIALLFTKQGVLIALGILLIGISILIFAVGLDEIPASNPPSKGLVTIWGSKTSMVLNEGIVILAPYFPFFYDAIRIDMTKKNKDLSFEVRCKSSEAGINGAVQSGGLLLAQIGLTWTPDPERLPEYINSGGEPGVTTIFDDMLPQALRKAGRERTWEEMIFDIEPLSNELIQLMTDLDLTNLTDQEKKEALEKMKRTGNGDIHGLGIKIFKLNVTDLSPEGELKEAANKQAVEEGQRRGEVYEVETEVRQAEVLMQAYLKDNPINDPEKLVALRNQCLIEIRRRKTIREGNGQVLDISGLDGIAAAFSNLLLPRR